MFSTQTAQFNIEVSRADILARAQLDFSIALAKELDCKGWDGKATLFS